MIPYIGDLSQNDAFILKGLAEESTAILEFGVGASTQILRHYSKGPMITLETLQEWIDHTIENLKLVEVKGEVKFIRYGDNISGKFDLIFVDGHKRLRDEFAAHNFKHLTYGGLIVFHDTRRQFHIDYISEFIAKFYLEIQTIEINPSNTNLTIIKKRRGLKYVNWNVVENRLGWKCGRGDFNMDEFLEYKKNQKP